MAAWTFIRWSRLGAWERLLVMDQERGIRTQGMTFIDGAGVLSSHHKAAGAQAQRTGGSGAPRRK